MKIGDRILSINNHNVNDLTISQIKMFHQGNLLFSKDDDESITLDLIIDGNEKEITLSSYEIF